jgi:uncharacterized repeat protein (TIGR01451 family)
VQQSASPNPASKNKPLTFTSKVTNGGPSSANGVTLTDSLPAGTTLRSVTTSQGTCSSSSGTVSCSLGGLASGASATVSVVVVPTAKGTITNSVTVRAASPPDPNSTNNTANTTVTVK